MIFCCLSVGCCPAVYPTCIYTTLEPLPYLTQYLRCLFNFSAHSEPNTAGRSRSTLNRIVLAAKGDSANAKSQMWETYHFPRRANQIRTGECRSQSPVPYRLAIAPKSAAERPTIHRRLVICLDLSFFTFSPYPQSF